MVERCVNHCLTLIFDGSTIHLILTLWILRWTPRQVTFSRWTWSIRNIFTTRKLTYRSVRHAINHPARGRTNSSQLYTIRSVTSYIIVTYSSVFVTTSVSQRFTAYCNSRNLHSFAIISNSIRILEHWPRITLRKIYTNWWITRYLVKPWRMCSIINALGKQIRGNDRETKFL